MNYSSSYDLFYKKVKFESFVALKEKAKAMNNHSTLRYNGSSICGDVEIEFPRYGEHEENEEFKRIAAEILTFFL